MLDIKFDFRSDSNNKDPDSHSSMLKKYHQILWSKHLPDGNFLVLDEDLNCYAEGYCGELASDSIVHTFYSWERYKNIIEQIDADEINSFVNLAYTIGGFLVFPKNKIDGKMTINGARGLNRKINDRIDLTLECIRRHYLGEESPLADCLNRYADFFKIFKDFKGYVDFFLLQDLVTEDYSEIRFFIPFNNFKNDNLPDTKEEYNLYKSNAITFLRKRNNRIMEFEKQMGKVVFYNLDGSYKTESSLSEEAIKNTIGMKVRCSLKNGDIVIGFSEPYRSKSKDFDGTVHDYINVWTWKHSDELAKNTKNPHKYDQIFERVYIDNILNIEAILYSSARFGMQMTNKFVFCKKINHK